MKHEEYILLSVLFILGLLLWTAPIRQNGMPFGEGDAAWHFGNSDAAAQEDQAFWRLPRYIGAWYYGFNKALGPMALEYPPSWHVNGAFFQIIGGERIVPIFIYHAIACFIYAFTLYFFIRKLYGFWPALISCLGVLFSYRTIMVYLWGQRPSITAFMFTPIILYCLYKFFEGYIWDYKSNIKYLYLITLLIAGQFLIHVVSSIQTFFVVIVCTVLFAIKYKFVPIRKELIKHYAYCFVLLALITGPFYILYLGADTGAFSGEVSQPERMLYWFNIDKLDTYPDIGGAPLTYYDPIKNYFPFYSVLVVIGIVFLLVRRDDEDLIMLSWLIGMYISLHLDIFGLVPFARVSRILLSETMLFYPLMVIGLFGFIDMIKEREILRGILKGVSIFFLLIMLLNNFNLARDTLDNSYNSPMIKISDKQYEMANWIEQNIPHNSDIYYVGTATYPKMRFMQMLSKSNGVWQKNSLEHDWLDLQYVLVDHSDAALTHNNQLSWALTKWSEQFIDTQSFGYVCCGGEQKRYSFNGTVEEVYGDDYFKLYKLVKE